jgi:Rho GTPase-activating protein 1
VLPLNYDPLRSRLFATDLARIMGADGQRGLPRVITDAISYLRAEGTPSGCETNLGLGSEGLFRVSPSQSLLRCAMAAYDRGHPVDLRDYGPHVAAGLIKHFLSMLPMPVFPAHIYPALTKFATIPESDRTEFVQSSILAALDPCITVLLNAVVGLLNGNLSFGMLLTKTSHPRKSSPKCPR